MKNSQIRERESVASTQLDTFNHGRERLDTSPESFEGAARAALDSRAGLPTWRSYSRPVRDLPANFRMGGKLSREGDSSDNRVTDAIE
jgi:hypothetical protein